MVSAVVFPGQGTQEPGMGRVWLDDDAWSVVERVEAVSGVEVTRLVTDAPAEELARTDHAQLAVFAVSLAAWEAMRRERSPEPVAFAGHSLGQVTALVAAGALDLDAGIRLATRRASLTARCAEETPGRMAALIGADEESAEAACALVPDRCWVANLNAPGQVVVGGTPEAVDEVAARAREVGVRKAVPLQVGGAFHTPLMAPAAEQLGEVLSGIEFGVPRAPVVCNTDATARERGWQERLSTHLVSPVRWHDSVVALRGLGVDELLEVGHGTMLAGLARRSDRDLPVRSVSSPDDLELVTA